MVPTADCRCCCTCDVYHHDLYHLHRLHHLHWLNASPRTDCPPTAARSPPNPRHRYPPIHTRTHTHTAYTARMLLQNHTKSTGRREGFKRFKGKLNSKLPATRDHTVLTATRDRWTRPAGDMVRRDTVYMYDSLISDRGMRERYSRVAEGWKAELIITHTSRNQLILIATNRESNQRFQRLAANSTKPRRKMTVTTEYITTPPIAYSSLFTIIS